MDFFSFRNVCRTWRSFFPLSSRFLSPIWPRFHSPILPLTISSKFRVYATAVYALRPRNGVQIEGYSSISMIWLLFVDQLKPGKLSIRKPLTERKIKHYGLNIPRKLNMLDFRVSEIGRSYRFAFHNRGGYSHKAVFSSNGSAVVVLLDDGKLGLLRLGLENELKIIHGGFQIDGFQIDDIISYQDRILVIDRLGKVYEIEILDYNNSSEMKLIVGQIRGGGLRRRKRLIESLGMLHSVFRFNESGTQEEMDKFKVCVLDEKIMKWVVVTSVGDQIFFFTRDFSFSTSSHEFEGSFGKNCIIFGECSFMKKLDYWLFRNSKFDAPRVGVYHLEDGAQLHPIDSYPDYSKILWPPPIWLSPNKLELLEIFETASTSLLTMIHDEKAKFAHMCGHVSGSGSGSGYDPSMGPPPHSQPNYNYAHGWYYGGPTPGGYALQQPCDRARPKPFYDIPSAPRGCFTWPSLCPSYHYLQTRSPQHVPYAYGSAQMARDGYTHPRYPQLANSYGQNMQPRSPQQDVLSGSTSTQQGPYGSAHMTHDGYTHPRCPQLADSSGQNMQPYPPHQYVPSGSTSKQQGPYGSAHMTLDGYTHPRYPQLATDSSDQNMQPYPPHQYVPSGSTSIQQGPYGLAHMTHDGYTHPQYPLLASYGQPQQYASSGSTSTQASHGSASMNHDGYTHPQYPQLASYRQPQQYASSGSTSTQQAPHGSDSMTHDGYTHPRTQPTSVAAPTASYGQYPSALQPSYSHPSTDAAANEEA